MSGPKPQVSSVTRMHLIAMHHHCNFSELNADQFVLNETLRILTAQSFIHANYNGNCGRKRLLKTSVLSEL